MVRELGLAEILDSVQSDSVKERESGLADLRYALDYHRKKNGLQDIRDKSVHHVFEVLFQVASKERVSYAKAAKPTVKSASASRLASCATALRSTTTILVHRIRLKTLRSFLGHVVQVLPYAEEGLCVPLSSDYIKALMTVLGYQPHVEHLSREDWTNIADFCLEAVAALDESLTQSASNADSLFASRASDVPSQRNSGRVPSSQHSHGKSAQSRENIYGLVHCLRHLTLIPSAPIPQCAPRMYTGIFNFLDSCTTTTSAHVAAFGTINAVLARMSLNDASFIANAMHQMLPLTRNLWHFRDSALRDQLLTTMIILMPHLDRAKGSEKEMDASFGLIEALLDEMRIDYLQNEQRDRRRLIIDDVCFTDRTALGDQSKVMSLNTFSLRLGNLPAEHGWTLVSVMGYLVSWLDERTIRSRQARHEVDNLEIPRKRTKPAPLRLEDLLEHARVGPVAERMQTLQVILFATYHRRCSDSEIQNYVQAVAHLTEDAVRAVSSWASLVIAEFTAQAYSCSPYLRSVWSDVWQSTWKHIVSAPQCRIACHVLSCLLRNGCVSNESVSSFLENMFVSTSLHGPALVCDSSIALWVNMATFVSKSKNGLSSSQQAFLEWLLTKWQPSKSSNIVGYPGLTLPGNFENRGYAHQLSSTTSIVDMLEAVSHILGSKIEAKSRCGYFMLGDLGQSWKLIHDQNPLYNYLFLLQHDIGLMPLQDGSLDEEAVQSNAPHPKLTPKDGSRLLSFFSSELDRIVEYLPSTVNSHPQSLNTDMIQILSVFCHLGCIIAAATSSLRPDSSSSFLRNLKLAMRSLCDYTARSQTPQSTIEDLLANVMPMLPKVSDATASGTFKTLPPDFLDFTAMLSLALQTRKIRVEATMDADVTQYDEFEAEQDSQTVRVRRKEFQALQRHDSGNSTSKVSFCASVEAYINLIAFDQRFDIMVPSTGSSALSFVDYLTKQTAPAFLATKPFLQQFVSSSYGFSVEDATRLLDFVKANYLADYDFERGEVSIDLSLRLMRGFLALWSDSSVPIISDDGADLYDWFIDKYPACSPRVQASFSDLLSDLLDSSPDYGRDTTRPSVRTILLNVLRGSELPVQYHIAQEIPKIFGKFVLGRHEMIFDDVHDALPRDETKSEGIALRLFILAKLGSSWRTLLRRCVYHIFETAGSVPSAAGHAKRCMNDISSAYHLSNPRDLLMLFKGQLLFTWLEKDQANQNLDTIPYTIFDYTSLKTLLESVRSEVVSQIAMRGDPRQVTQLENILGYKFSQLVCASFGQTMAYVFAKDASNKEPSQSRRFETSIRDLIGQDKYVNLLQQELATIIAHSMDHLRNEDQIGKHFAKREGYENTAIILAKIKSLGASTADLPLAQQPSFKARYLPETLSRLGRRLHKDAKSMWTTQNVIVIVRLLLNGISTTIGSLHARRVIARLAVMVSLAPHVTNQGYPLQQLVHGLRPLVVDQHCAADAVCLMQHLFILGQDSLKKSAQFSLGSILALQLSLKTFAKRPQEATTQESEHLATTLRVENFQSWLNEFSQHLIPETTADFPDTLVRSFRNILKAAKTVGPEANASPESSEGTLLKLLLTDIRSGRQLLSSSFRKLCFESFCKVFAPPLLYHDDMFGVDANSERYMSQLWESCKQYRLSDAYIRWAGKALGRSFGCNGRILSSMASESHLRHNRRLSKSSHDDWSSEAAIVRCLVDGLEGKDSLEVGAAECTLRRIFNTAWQTDKGHLLSSTVSEHLTIGFSGTSFAMDFQEAKVMEGTSIFNIFLNASDFAFDDWVQHLVVAICYSAPSSNLLSALVPAVETITLLSKSILPFVLHLALSASLDESSYSIDDPVSKGITHLFGNAFSTTFPHVEAMLNCILYLRTQPFPGELTRLERAHWISDLDLELCAKAAANCRMFKTAALLLEISRTRSEVSNAKVPKHEPAQAPVPANLLLAVFKQIDEPDSYYGIEQPSTLDSIASRLDFEGSSIESLMLHGAEADSLARTHQDHVIASSKVLVSLSRMNLNCLTQQLGLEVESSGMSSAAVSIGMMKSAMKLRKWDVPSESANFSSSGILYKTMQSIATASSLSEITGAVDQGLQDAVSLAKSGKSRVAEPLRHSFAALSALTEVNDLLTSRYTSNIAEIRQILQTRERWMIHSSAEEVSTILSFRESFFGTVTSDVNLQNHLHLTTKGKWLNEVQTNLHSSRVYRSLGATQDALANVVHLSNITKQCNTAGVFVDSAVKLETARVLWDRGERVPSIKMLQDLNEQSSTSSDAIELGRAGLLATLAHSISEARLEKPGEVMKKYLQEALLELGGTTFGHEAGQVFHEFASYCHNQLTSPDFLSEFERSEKFRRGKRKELEDLEGLSRSKMTDQEKHKLRGDKARVKKWLSIDEQDYKRLKETRDQLLRQSLENYLRSLTAWNDQDHDMLRFFSLWLQHANEDAANETIGAHINLVPSRKFIRLMNQLASRLQDSKTQFQAIMGGLVSRICHEHPYHGMKYVFAGSKTEGGNDLSARSRHAAASKIAKNLTADKATSQVWSAITKSNELFIKAASVKTEEMKQGAKLRLKNFNATKAVELEIPALKVPPITMSIDVREDLDYSGTPTIASFHPQMSIAGGISTPKILTAISSNGTRHVQLYKGGSDDLRQDAIMEQVFEQVSALLKTNKATRQRNLRIRTYNVVPLNANTGAIEFVSNTMSFNEYLNEAHIKYNPSDLKWNAARRKIDAAKELKLPGRVQVYKEVTEKFSPVLRHFFFENFEDPDEWFATRLAYTRSTATISMLGHILGLGDRHCQNILLDKTTGEVVHIDLGVAFEAGRILNIPEVVPFRLTRDVVDGFGITKTEGVFRRCCEFTLEALRKNKDAIMTLLNVLRYDPLYSWSVSPLRAKKLQQEQEREMAAAPDPSASAAVAASMTSRTRNTRASAGQEELRVAQFEEDIQKGPAGVHIPVGDDDGGEADRALSVVEKKLATGLSVEATVHELIQQATDERNLAVLFCGWAAFA